MDLDTLSVKERHQLAYDWQHLGEACLDRGRAVTAAEYAVHMGIARSTAGRRLIALVEAELAETFRQTGKNRYPKITYQPTGHGQTWDYTYGRYDDAEGAEE